MNHLAIRVVSALVTFLLGLSVTAIISPYSFRVSSDPAAEQEVLRVERQYIQAHLNRDVATLDDILADEFFIGSSRCRSTNKAQRLALVSNPNVTFEAINTDDVQVKVNGDSAEVTGVAVVQSLFGGEEYTSPQYRFTRQ
jgi:hypothetical protein